MFIYMYGKKQHPFLCHIATKATTYTTQVKNNYLLTERSLWKRERQVLQVGLVV